MNAIASVPQHGATIQQMYTSAYSQSDKLPNINGRNPNSSVAQNPMSSRVKYSTIQGQRSPYVSPRRQVNKDGSLAPSAALAQYGRLLSPFEQEEIKQFNSSIWFVGPTARKLNAGEGKGKNFGYDDDKGRYKCVKNDHIYYRYEVLKGLGKGSFGDVVRAYDHKTKTTVALKIIRNEKRFHKQGRCEVKILDHLRRHDRDHSNNVVHMKDFFIFRNHLCITFEIMHSDMYSALKKDGFRGFKLPDVMSFAENMCIALKLLKAHRIIHCDLKPENILLKNNTTTDLKIIDFGSSCFDHERVHSYIQSRFYRSPEVILGLSYGTAIDMWSLGCILAELYTGQPLFPGHDEKEQLMYQMQVLGVPTTAVLAKGKRVASFFDAAKDMAPMFTHDKKGRVRAPGTRPLKVALGTDDPIFLDFLEKCFIWDPAERLTPGKAMEHAFIQNNQRAAELIPGFGSLQLDDESENQAPTNAIKSGKAKVAKKPRTHLASLASRLKARKSSKP
jgi:dual specificity tyrosine-phosphorylation-regulated kinase 2/3/4